MAKMNKLWSLLLCAFTLSASVQAQKGIQFRSATWEQMLAEARDSGKLIFMDAYAVWCGPCKWMNQHVFPAPEVGNLYNRNFINAYIDMEKGEGIALRKQYDVRAYPTYLFINGEGEVVHKIVGSCDTVQFLQAALDALSPTRNLQYYEKNFSNNQGDYDFVSNYARVLAKAYDPDKAGEVVETYLKTVDPANYIQPANWSLIKDYVINATSPVFQHLVANQAAFQSRYEANVVEGKIHQTYLSWPRRYVSYPEEGSPVLDRAGYQAFIQQLVNGNYARKREIAALSDLTIQFGMRDWGAYAKTVDRMLAEKLIDTGKAGVGRLFGYADNINRFGSENKEALQAAIRWARHISKDVSGIPPQSKAMYLELYATLLEKNKENRLAKKVRKEVDEEKLKQAKNAMPFQPVRIIPKQQ